MSFKVKGNLEQALVELKNDKSNSVTVVLGQSPVSPKTSELKDVVFTLKANYAIQDIECAASSKILKGFKPSYNATVVQKLLEAGAIPAAQVNCDELALGGTGTYSCNGLIRNPLDPKRLVGGSSSGSVATLTDNIGFALGSDTGDSVRLPASYNGKVGFKPSYGAISRFGLYAYASSLDTVAFFTHNVSDAVKVSQCTYGIDSKDFNTKKVGIQNVQKTKPQKVGVLKIDNLNSQLSNAYQKLFKELSKEFKGDEIFEWVEVDEKILTAIKPVYDIISYSEASSNLSNLNGIAFGNRKDGENWEQIMTNTRSQGFDKMVQRRLTLGSFFLFASNQEELFLKAQKARRVIVEYLKSLHNKYDVLVFPASADKAPLIDGTSPSYGFMDYILTGSNLGGNPSISIPFTKVDGLPVNLALDAKLYADDKLLSYALWFEEFLTKFNKKGE
ncbi:amidase family protein [Mycoplasmopsis columbinasalis]|uniref:Aspartyl/glutamyl-tRNA(Asn/Gln) amidotransferase subunit A n=1 Tax=Mycoplasmopsis columbinasalis TaxID=114880 RepID=A0A449BAE5_9BACT|nr:amidase family protein [Mycoplasmopsis columbinasalis]VEU78139.1 aspartyl/glutamyl-tRNA(Asn/Gln) amidotransferase subunit A [Mycoplasmopsis columbinasalis]